MRPAYVRADLIDSEANSEPLFVISPLPFLYRQGELLIPVDIKTYEAKTYSALESSPKLVEILRGSHVDVRQPCSWLPT